MAYDSEGFYEDDDERRGKLLDPLINPIAAGGGDPDQRQGQVNLPNEGQVTTTGDPGRPGSQDYNGPKLIPRNAAAAPAPSSPPSSPPTAPATGPKSFKEYLQAGMAGQYANAQASDRTTASLASQPDEATTIAPLAAKSAALGQPLDPQAQQYKPGIGTRIIRGIDALRRGGVLGTIDPADVGGKAYSAPNKQYDIDTARRGGQKAVVDQQISEAQKAFQDATARAKGIATEQRATAGAYKDVTSAATQQETEENTAGRDVETGRHNRVDEGLKGQAQTQTAANEQGNLQQRTREVNIQGGRLALAKHREDYDEAQDNTPGGDENIRQPLIDQATAKLTRFKAGVSYKPEFGNYMTEAGKPMGQDEYIAQINQIGADLDESLAKKKQPPLGLRYKPGPNGQEIPFQTPRTQPKGGTASPAPATPAATTPKEKPAERQTQATVHSKQQVAVGDTVMFHGQPQVVAGFNEKGQIKFRK